MVEEKKECSCGGSGSGEIISVHFGEVEAMTEEELKELIKNKKTYPIENVGGVRSFNVELWGRKK